MAHFAKITEDNKVLQVLTVNNSDVLNSDGFENEAVGYNTHKNQHRNEGTPFRGNYAGIGYDWDSVNQIFWPPKPYDSWVKLISEARWQSPVGDAPELSQEQINTGHYYSWNELNQTWDLQTF